MRGRKTARMSGVSSWIDANWNIWRTEEYLCSTFSKQNPPQSVHWVLAGSTTRGGGPDETPEEAILGGNTQEDWSLKTPTNDPVPTVNDMYGYRIEELLTIDFEDIPSTND
jgi:hypothetical protein